MRGLRRGNGGLADFVMLALIIGWWLSNSMPVAMMNQDHLKVLVRNEITVALELERAKATASSKATTMPEAR